VTIFDDTVELMDPAGVQVKPFTGRDANGAPTYGSPVTYAPALALRVDKRIKQPNGDTVIITLEVYAPPSPEIDKRSLVIYRGKERKIFDVASFPDPEPTFVDGFQVVHAQ
jgi:hypothetical protein